jgi:hypothetical protein
MQRFTHLFKRNVLQLANSFAGDAEFDAYFFESHGSFSVQSKPGVDDAMLAFIKNIEQVIKFSIHIFVVESLKRIHRMLVSDYVRKFCTIVIVHRGIQRGGALGGTLK